MLVICLHPQRSLIAYFVWLCLLVFGDWLLGFWFLLRFELLLELCNASAKRWVDHHKCIQGLEVLSHQTLVHVLELCSNAGVFFAICSAPSAAKITNREKAQHHFVHIFINDRFELACVVLTLFERSCRQTLVLAQVELLKRLIELVGVLYRSLTVRPAFLGKVIQ